MINKKYFCMLAFLAFSALATAQSTQQTEKEQTYIKVIDQRAQKIVATLDIKDAAKAKRVEDIIATRYHQLNDWQNEEEAKVKAAKTENASDGAALKAKMDSYQKEEDAKINSSHKDYISALSKELTAQQVDKVKDGMTYNVLPITYKGYQEMIPDLTEKQKAQIFAWLTEAREHAIDAGTSEKKHWWFGKYKGRINNYLSGQGYDLKKEEADWQKRRESAKAAVGK
jgi:hypothetical protein